MPSGKRQGAQPKPKPVPGIYTAPYIDSAVFIAWIQGEVEKDGTDRGKIGEHILALAERGHYRLTCSHLVLAEVFKPKGYDPLNPTQNQKMLDYFEHDFFDWVMVDREIGLEANRIAAMYGLNPNDAIHTASALRAGCDVLLTWDEPFWKRSGTIPGIRIERPQPLGQLLLSLSDDGKGSTGEGQAPQQRPGLRGNDAAAPASKAAAKAGGVPAPEGKAASKGTAVKAGLRHPVEPPASKQSASKAAGPPPAPQRPRQSARIGDDHE